MNFHGKLEVRTTYFCFAARLASLDAVPNVGVVSDSKIDFTLKFIVQLTFA